MFSTDAGSHADDAIAEASPEAVPEAIPEADSAGGDAVGLDVADDEAGADGAFPAGDEEEPFWGMQSEGMQDERVVLRGVALGSEARNLARSLARVCLAVALGLGVVFWAVLIVLYAHRAFFQGASTNPDMPHLADDRPWTAYYLLGAVWAVGIGVWALATRGGFARLIWCFACLATAFFWPLGMAASVVTVAIRRPAVATSRRLLLAGLAVLLIAGGSAWRFTEPSADPKPAAVGSDADLLGTWRSHSGMSVDLRSDGTYDASALTGDGLGSGDGVPASSGRWDSETGSGGSDVRLQVDGDLASSIVFDVYRAGPDLVLCMSGDPDVPCAVALRRG